MRVVVLLDRWRRGRGGLEVYLDRVLPALAARHSVLFLARDATRRPPQGVQAQEARARLPLPRPWRDVADSLAQVRAAKALQPDRVLTLRRTPFEGAFWQPHDGSAPHRRAALGRPRPSRRDRVLEQLEATTLRDCGRLLAVSPKIAREMQERRPGLEATVLPPPLPADLPAPRPHPLPGPVQIVYCGQDARRKGAGAALAWFRALQARLPEARMRMWSRSVAHLERVLGARASRLESEGVTLSGWDGSFRDGLAAAHLLMLPTLYDPCALVCVEAAAMGVPVLTSGANGFSELVGAPLVATAAPGEPEEAAAAAAGLLAGRRGAAQGEIVAAAAEVRRRFSLEAHVAGLCRALEAGP